MIVKLALRNLFRNRWRSALTAGGVAVATALLTWSICLFDGMITEMVRGATAVQMGQIQVHQGEYVEHPTLFNYFPEDTPLIDQIRSLPEVDAVSPRAYAYGLAGHERRSQVVQLIGVDPAQEARTTVITDGLVQGRWLSQVPPPQPRAREVVIGHTFAEQLGLSVGDEIVLFLQAADGSLGNDLLQIVGILRTGNLLVDRQALYMHLADLQYDAVLEGRLHELAIRIEDLAEAPQVTEAVTRILDRRAVPAEAPDPSIRSLDASDDASGERLVARPWQAIVPELSMYVELTDRSIWITIVMVYLMVALGILNAQRMSALERRREFGVLLAIGLTPRQLRHIVIVETVLLTLAGAVLGAVGGFALSAFHAHYGFDMGMFSERATFTYMGVAFNRRIYFVLSAGSVLLPLVSVTVVAILCGLWPAIKSARLNVTQAISGRT